jgi:hypothetical protein
MKRGEKGKNETTRGGEKRRGHEREATKDETTTAEG